MRRNPKWFAKRARLFAPAGIFLTMFITVWFGCAGNFGRLQNSPDVTEIFNSSQVLSDHQYYYSGFQSIPYGLMAIDNRYTLRSKYWRPIDPDPTRLNQLIYRMKTVYGLPPRGAWILDQNGTRVGVWYASQYWTKIKLEPDNTLVVVPPEPPDLRGGP